MQPWESYIGLLRIGIKKERSLKSITALNKTQSIAGQDRGTHEIFLQNAKTSQYACNSAPIDGTDILRSVAAVGRKFRFLLNVELLQTLTTLNQGNYSMYEYLWHIFNNSQFSSSILHILIEERQTVNRERLNQNISATEFKVGNAIKSHFQVQSKSDTGEIAKLVYRARGPFQIKIFLGTNSYEIWRYNDPTSGIHKYKGSELYLFL